MIPIKVRVFLLFVFIVVRVGFGVLELAVGGPGILRAFRDANASLNYSCPDGTFCFGQYLNRDHAENWSFIFATTCYTA
jgi:hypothetical protein